MSSDCNNENNSSAEYEVQHYGFSASIFLRDFQLEINDNIQNIHRDLKKYIIKHLNLDNDQQIVLSNEISNLSKRMEEVVENSFRTHEADVRKFFAIPENVLLENDIIHENDSMENIEDLENDIERLKKEYLKEKYLIAIYQQDLENFKKIEALQQDVNLKLKQMKKIPELLKQVKVTNELSNRYERVVIQLESECGINIRTKINQLKHKHKNQKTRNPLI